MGWELFVGFRYLRSRRRENFVSVITLISTLSVLLGVMVLTIVLSVMTGFEEDLRDYGISAQILRDLGLRRVGPRVDSG